MARQYTLLLVLIFFGGFSTLFAFASEPTTILSDTSNQVQHRQLVATRIVAPPRIDGVLEQEAYGLAELTTGMTLIEPSFGGQDEWPTRIKVTYDDNALYVAAHLYYPTKEQITVDIKERDQFGNSDWFGLIVDPYQSGVNGFGFYSTSAGGQGDAVFSSNGQDFSWDAVWRNSIVRSDSGYTVEMAIPYSALRFPSEPVQTWNINFVRKTRINQAKSFWNPVDPTVQGLLSQSGQLAGLRDIKAPPRIQLQPFTAFTLTDNIDKANDPKHNYDRNFGAGADLKVGLGNAFTLDMTLIPDFSEARQDDQVLNLSPFEVRFDENRPFFTEGVELFNKGGYFYSRRVGGRPVDYYGAEDEADQLGGTVQANPAKARLVNATKLSGRTNTGTGLGLFNAISAPTNAEILIEETGEIIEFETQPVTNYNVFVVDQILPNNSFVSLVNTNVTRFSDTYDANLTGTVFDLRNKENEYGIKGSASLSQRIFKESTERGHNYNLEVGKISGNFRYNMGYKESSPTYNPSDLGFFKKNNVREVSVGLSYNYPQEVGPFNSWNSSMRIGYERYIEPNQYSELWWFGRIGGETKKNWSLGFWTYNIPVSIINRFEPRTEGMYFRQAAETNFGFRIRSDDRKRLFYSAELKGEHYYATETTQGGYDIEFAPTYRASGRLTMGVAFALSQNTDELGFADFAADNVPVFGRRERRVITNSANVEYTITPKIGFLLTGRHYWNRVHYDRYFDLLANGELEQNDKYLETIEASNNFNALTTDFVFRWRFAPGSDILLIWKDALIAGYDEAERGYFETWNDGLWNEPRTQNLTLKINYWLDWATVRDKFRTS